VTYRFRINPNARWADGQPVTAEDVVASWNFNMDEGLQSPFSRMTWSKFAQPFAESKYIVRVQSTKVNWRNFLYFSGSLPILPASLDQQKQRLGKRTTDLRSLIDHYLPIIILKL